MSTALAAGQLLELKVFTNDSVQQGINVLHYTVASVTGGTMSDQTFANNFSPNVAAVYKPYMSASAEYAGIRLQILRPLPIAVAVTSLLGAGAGADVTLPLPPQVSGLVAKYTALAGRTGRGRLYLPFWGESANSGLGVPSGAAQALALTTANFLLTTVTIVVGLVTTTLTPVIWNRVTGAATPIAAFAVRTKWATQRRRSLINKPDTFGP